MRTSASYESGCRTGADQFNTCLDSRANDAKVMAAYQEGVKNGVDRTPTVFINHDRRFALSPAEWDQLLAGK
jgi:protein-disulfide isomerase